MRFLTVIIGVALTSCGGGSCDDMHFERLREANRAVITVESHTVGAEIRSPDALRRLVDFAEEHSSGWGYPWYDSPVARLRVDFFAGSRFLGDIGVGDNFLSAQGCGYFQSRQLSRADRKRLISLIGVPESYASWK
jgi:hypothetical protein